MASDLLIYGMKGSPFVRKVQVVLAEKAVEYEFERVNIFPAPDWFAEINPARRIPVLRDRSIGKEGVAGTIPDSSAICVYLEQKFPEPRLYPEEPFAHARTLWLEEFADSEVAPLVGLGMFRPMVVAPLMGKEPGVERARKTLREQLPPKFDYLENVLTGNGEGGVLVGDAFGIADIAVCTQFVNFEFAGGRLDAERWPQLAEYVTRIHARPSFADCISSERKLLPPADPID